MNTFLPNDHFILSHKWFCLIIYLFPISECTRIIYFYTGIFLFHCVCFLSYWTGNIFSIIKVMKSFGNCMDILVICIIPWYVLAACMSFMCWICLELVTEQGFSLYLESRFYPAASGQHASFSCTCSMHSVPSKSMLKFLNYLIVTEIPWWDGCLCFQHQVKHHLLLRKWNLSPAQKCNLQQLVTNDIYVVVCLKEQVTWQKIIESCWSFQNILLNIFLHSWLWNSSRNQVIYS